MASSLKLERTAVTRQATFWKERLVELSSLQAVLRRFKPLPCEFATLMKCRTDDQDHTVVCECCGKIQIFNYHCNKRFCPCCAWQLSCERRKVLENCQRLLKAPKHIVLTARNDEQLKRMLQVVLAGVRKLRRRAIFSQVRGGWCSFEVTNEDRGWHVHAHLLVDAPYIDAAQLAREWGVCVGQDYAIVKLKCCCGRCARCKESGRGNYLAELTKYTVKPSMFIKWSQDKREQFVKSIRGKRFFFAFGHVAEASRHVRAALKVSRSIARTKCCVNQMLTSVSYLSNGKRLSKVKR